MNSDQTQRLRNDYPSFTTQLKRVKTEVPQLWKKASAVEKGGSGEQEAVSIEFAS